MNSTAEDRSLHSYLRELRWALATLPEADRDDIVAEAESHLRDRIESGTPVAQALATLGPAARYAEEFLDRQRTASALGSGRVRELVPLLATRVARSVRAAASLVAIGALWAPVLLLVSTAVTKLIHPDTAGLWVSPTQQFIGVIDDPAAARELLGAWIFPLAALALAAAWLLTRAIARRALRPTA